MTPEQAADILLGGRAGAVGAGVRVRARSAGGATVRARNVGARAEMVPQGDVEPVGEYSEQVYNSSDISDFGLGSFDIIALSPNFATPVVRPDRPFTPQRFFLPSTFPGLLLNEALIQGVNILASSLGVAIERYSEVATFPQIEWPTIQPATGIRFNINNPTAGIIPFQPAFFGTDVRI